MNGKIGDNWFDEDPEWQELKRRIDNTPEPPKINQTMKGRLRRPTSAPSKPPTPRPPEIATPPKKLDISINLTMPKLPRVSRRHLRIAAVLVVVITALFGGGTLIAALMKNPPATGTDAPDQVSQEPTFDTLLPAGKQEETDSDRVGYDPERKVASFTDKIGSVNLTVSQQQLPEPFLKDPDGEIEKLAKNFSATEVIVESNPRAYIGTSVEGPQTAIFHKNGLLVFIFSSSSIDKEEWAGYITNLL